MRNVMEAILHRRAIRRFDARQVEEGDLAQILEAGLYAPSAGGGQRPLFVVCQNRELNLPLGKISGPTPGPAWPRAGGMSPKSSPALPTTPASPTPFTARPR